MMDDVMHLDTTAENGPASNAHTRSDNGCIAMPQRPLSDNDCVEIPPPPDNDRTKGTGLCPLEMVRRIMEVIYTPPSPIPALKASEKIDMNKANRY